MRLREPLASMLLHGLLVQPPVRLDECPRLVNTEIIRDAEDRGVADAITRRECVFYNPRADLVSAEIQDLFLTPSADQHVFIGEITDIPGIEISISECRA